MYSLTVAKMSYNNISKSRAQFSRLCHFLWLWKNKGMCVFLFDVFKHLLVRKTDVLKTSWKRKFLGKKLKKYASFEEQKGARYIWDNYYGIIIFRCLSSTKPSLRFLLNCFARKIKGCYQSSLGNEVDSRVIITFPQISWHW